MPKDEYENVRPIFGNMPSPGEMAKVSKTFEEQCKSSSIYDVMSEIKKRILDLGDENIHGIITLVVAKEAGESSFAYTPSIYEGDAGYAMALANISMLERMIHDEAENFRIASLCDETEDDL